MIFQGGSGPPAPPLDPRLVHAEHMGPWLRAQRRFALKLIGVFAESFGLFIQQLNYYVSRCTTPMVVTDSSTLECILELHLLMTYEELSRTFGQLQRLNLRGLNQVCKCIKNPTYLISIFFLGLSSRSTKQMIRCLAMTQRTSSVCIF